jgi:hypothetical protein
MNQLARGSELGAPNGILHRIIYFLPSGMNRGVATVTKRWISASVLAFAALLAGCGKEEAQPEQQSPVAVPQEEVTAPERETVAPETMEARPVPQTRGIKPARNEQESEIRKSLSSVEALIQDLKAASEDVKELESRKAKLESQLKALTKKQ